MSTVDTLPTASNRRSYRCYNCNCAFHITTSSGESSSFRCPRCFHRHLLPNYTIASLTPLPQPFTPNFTLPTVNFIFDYSDSETESDESESEDLSFELFNSTQFRSPTLKSFLDSLPSVKIHESSKNCTICMEDFGADTEASQLPCKHSFHKNCIVPWLNRSNTCPLCRYKLPQEDENETEKELQIILNGEIGDGEFQDNSVVQASAASLGFSDDGDLIHDEDGDVLMVDAEV